MKPDRVLTSVALAALAIGVVVFLLLRGPGLERGPAGDDAGVGDADLAAAGPITDADAREPDADAAAPVEETAAEALVVEPPPVDERPVSLEGRVTDPGGLGIAGAHVVLRDAAAWREVVSGAREEFDNPFVAVGSLQKRHDSLAEDAPSARTGEDGAYSFRGLRPAEYRVLASHPQHVPRRDALVLVPPEGAARCDIELFPGASITGRVVDEEGKPVGGAAVTARPSEWERTRGFGKVLRVIADLSEGGDAIEGLDAVTAADGTFRLASLEPVTADLTARKDGYAPGRARSVPPGARDVVVLLPRGGAVAGRIVGPSREPIAGAEVVLEEVKPELDNMNPALAAVADIDLLGEKTRRGESGSDGLFRLDGVETGTYELRVHAQGYPPRTEVVRVEGALVGLGEVLLEHPLSISGVVQDPTGLPVVGARVRAACPAAPRGGFGFVARRPGPVGEATSGAGGRFEIAPVPAGRYEVEAASDERGRATVTEIAAGRSDVTIVVGGGLRIAGKVLDAAGRAPIAGATVRLLTDGGRKVKTGDDGAFELAGVPETGPGDQRRVHLMVSHPEYQQKYSAEAIDSPGGIEVLLEEASGLTGVVLDGSGEPVAGARVSLRIPGIPAGLLALAPGGNEPVRSAEDGGFFLRMPVQERGMMFEVLASHSSGHARAGPFRADGGEPPPIELVLGSGSAIEGRVTDPAGAPVAGARVQALSAVELPPEMAMMAHLLPKDEGEATYTRPDGSYEIRGLAPASYRVAAIAPGFARRTIEPVELGTETRRVDMVLDPGASIRGRVVDGDRLPLPGVEVVIMAEIAFPEDERGMPERMARELQTAGSGFASARTDEDGRYELTHVPEGTFLVVARAQGYLTAHAGGVRGGQDVPDLVLVAFASIAGQTIDRETGLPMPRFQVRLAAKEPPDGFPGGWRERPFDDPEGRFSYDQLAPGEYELTVQTEAHVPWRRSLVLEPGAEEAVVAELERGSGVDGVVRSAETGEPIAGAGITVQPNGREDSWQLRRSGGSGADGSFSIRGMIEGEHHVSVQHASWFWDAPADARKVVVSRDAPARLDITLSLAARARGRIAGLQAWEPGRVGYQVHFTRIEEGEETRRRAPGRVEEREERRPAPSHSAFVDTSGEYSADSLRPGRYRVEVERVTFGVSRAPSDGQRQPLGDVELYPGETTTFDADAGG